jgi:hypothetical protein
MDEKRKKRFSTMFCKKHLYAGPAIGFDWEGYPPPEMGPYGLKF